MINNIIMANHILTNNIINQMLEYYNNSFMEYNDKENHHVAFLGNTSKKCKKQCLIRGWH